MLLQSLDAVVAFTTVMLVLSLMITAVVQLVISLCGLRGRNVMWGLKELFQRTLPADDQAALEAKAGQLARQVLSHSTLSTSTNRLLGWLEKLLGKRGEGKFNGGNRPPAALHLNDVKLVLSDLGRAGGLAADVEAAAQVAAAAGFDPEVAKDLAATLKRRFPEQEAAVAAAVGELEAKAQQAVARARQAAQHFEDWFELTMDAAAEKLKLHSRWITVAAALVLAFGLRVDSIGIMHQLFENPELTAQVLAQTANVQAIAAGQQGDSAEGKAAVEALELTLADLRGTLDETGLEVFHPFDGWRAAWCFYFGKKGAAAPDDNQPRLLGFLATVLLLSLGAPFWSGALGKLLGFRAILRKRQGEEGSAAAAGG